MKTTVWGTLLALAMLAGCSRDDGAVGPAQRAGRALDAAGVNVSRQMEGELAKADRATDNARARIKDATKDGRSGLKRAGGDLGKRLEDAGEKIRDVVD